MAMPHKPKHPQSFLKDSAFLDIFRRIELHDKLLRSVKEALPEMLASECQHCVAREDGALVIFSDSQMVASQLRFYAPSILAKLNENLESPFKRVLVRNLPTPEPEIADKPMMPTSPEVIEMVKARSKDSPCDELAVALAKLGATMERHAKAISKK